MSGRLHLLGSRAPRKKAVALSRLGAKASSYAGLSLLVFLLVIARFWTSIAYGDPESKSVSNAFPGESNAVPGGWDAVHERSLRKSEEVFPLFFFMTRVKTGIALLLRLTAASNSDAPLYIITSSETPPEESVSEELRSIGVRVIYFDPNPARGSSVELFRQHYVHHSVNAVWYERLCYERFLILEDIITREGIERFYYFDADIVFFKDLRDTPYVRHLDKDLVGLTRLSSSNSLWRLDVLRRFCKYVLWFYQRPPELLNKDIERWGVWVFPYKADNTNSSQRVRQFSDMYLFAAFLQTHNFSRFLILYEEEIPSRVTELLAIEHPDGLRHRGETESTCSSVEAFDSYVKWRALEDGRQVPYYNETVLAGLQFEGLCKKQVMPHILRKYFPERSDDEFQWL